jgi:hypothetical protein
MDRRDEHHKLYSCYLKLRRVEQHADALQDALDGFLGSNPYAIICEREPKLDEYVLWTKVREQPPPEWSPIVGDIVHNWRSALDHLAYQLVIRNGNTPSSRTQFPIFSKSPFDASLYSKTKDAKNALERWNGQVSGMHPSDVAVIERLQPYKGGHGPDTHPLFSSTNFPTGTSTGNTNSPDKHVREPLSTSGSGGTANGGPSTRGPSDLSKTAQ